MTSVLRHNDIMNSVSILDHVACDSELISSEFRVIGILGIPKILGSRPSKIGNTGSTRRTGTSIREVSEDYQNKSGSYILNSYVGVSLVGPPVLHVTHPH